MPARRFKDLCRKLQVKCRFKSGMTVDLDVLDLSPGGCLVDRKKWGTEAGDRTLIKLPGLGFQPAYVAWVEDEHAGIAFEQPLHEAVLDHLWMTFATPSAA